LQEKQEVKQVGIIHSHFATENCRCTVS